MADHSLKTDSAVELESVTKLFPSTGIDAASGKEKYTLALDEVSFSIKKGSLTVLGGANGSGKSVLMQIIAGLMKATAGTVFTASKPGLVFQDAATQILGDTAREDVAVGLKNRKLKKDEIRIQSEKALAQVSLLDKADNLAEYLSGGEKRRLAVASILALQRDIIIFDEPYANLDYPGVLDVNGLIEKLHSDGKTVIVLSHELEKCLALADHFIILHKGKLVFDGLPKDALTLKLEDWGIRNPLTQYKGIEDLVWKNKL